MQKLIELHSLLMALTGSAGTSELEAPQIDALIHLCQSLAGDALDELSAM